MEIKPQDLEITTYCTGSAWARKENGVRIKHVPSGLVAECAEERSQHRNKAKAFEELQAKVASWKPTKEGFDNSTFANARRANRILCSLPDTGAFRLGNVEPATAITRPIRSLDD